MRIVKNEKLIRSRSRMARWLMPVGLVSLLGGFILSLNIGNPESQVGSWVALVIGVITSSFGVNLADKWMPLPQRPRADQTLEGALKTLDIKHKLYSWAIPGAEQVLLSPAGLTVFLVKKQEGEIICDGGKWKNKLGLRQMLASLSRERLGNPPKDLQAEIDQVKTLVATAVPDADVPVDGLIVLSNPTAKINIDGCSDNAAVPADLRDKYRALVGTRRMTEATYKRVEEALDENASPDAVEIGSRPGTSSSAKSSSGGGSRATSTPTRVRSRARSRFMRPTPTKPAKPPRQGQ
jgi:hypothetical protein